MSNRFFGSFPAFIVDMQERGGLVPCWGFKDLSGVWLGCPGESPKKALYFALKKSEAGEKLSSQGLDKIFGMVKITVPGFEDLGSLTRLYEKYGVRRFDPMVEVEFPEGLPEWADREFLSTLLREAGFSQRWWATDDVIPVS